MSAKKIIAGLKDATAHAEGDQSRAHVTNIAVSSSRDAAAVNLDDRMEQLIAKLCAERGCSREELKEQMFGAAGTLTQ